MEIKLNNIYNENCLEGMRYIEDKSIDLILCDLPYGVTAKNKWDTVLPFDQLWEQYKRIIKDRGVIALFGQGMFTADLMESNKAMWRYNLIWEKDRPSGFLNANRMPLRSHEDILIFYKKAPTYNPQKVKGKKSHSKGTMKNNTNNDYGDYTMVDNTEKLGDMKHPRSVLKFPRPHPPIHPTQKPVELCEWLIKSYSNENDVVLDNCIGSGTTIVAAINTERQYIGFETEKEYFKIAEDRIKDIYNKLNKVI